VSKKGNDGKSKKILKNKAENEEMKEKGDYPRPTQGLHQHFLVVKA